MVQFCATGLFTSEKQRKKDLEQHCKGGILYGIKGKRLLVLMLATLCSLIAVLGWEGSPASTVLGTRGWRPALRLELALVAGALDLSRFSRAATVSQNGTSMEMLHRSSSEIAAQKESPVAHVYKQDCDYSKGKWVKDSSKPLYSGKTCTQFLSRMWACRLTERQDFDYEQYRWQPDGCYIPKFDGRTFLSRWRNKTIAFVGDSLGRQQFQSLLCMITEGRDDSFVVDVGSEFGFDLRPSWSVRPNGWAYRFEETNTTILFHWSASLCRIRAYNASDPSSAAAMHLDRPPEFLKRYINRIDLVILNTGHHWNSGKILGNRWEMYVGGKKVTNSSFSSISYAHRYAVKNVVKWLDKQIRKKKPGLRGFFTALSPRHFMNGDWNSGGRCDNTKPFGVEVSKRPLRDTLAENVVLNTRVELLSITYLSQFRGEAHISKFSPKSKEGIQDCLHWCLPGVPDVWNEILNAQLLAKNGV